MLINFLFIIINKMIRKMQLSKPMQKPKTRAVQPSHVGIIKGKIKGAAA